MPLDPSIITGGKPVEIQTPSPLELISGVAKLQDVQAQVEQRRQAADKARQQAADQADVQRAMAAAGGDVETALPQLYATNPRAAAGFEETVGKARKETLDAANKGIENQKNLLAHYQNIYGMVTDDASNQAIRPLFVKAFPALDAVLPTEYGDGTKVQAVKAAVLSQKDQLEAKQKNLELFAQGKFHESLGNVLSQPDITPAKWDQAIQGAVAMGMPRAVADEFGGVGGFSDANVANAARLAVPQAKRVELAATRTPAQQALDAYAQSLGKPDASALTDADRQTYAKRQAAMAGAQQVQTHADIRQSDIEHPLPEKPADQGKLEQQYRTVLARGLSSRSGGIGLEDAKVQQANHLLALMDQNYDPTTGRYNIPKTQQTELALGLARLVSPGGQAGVQMVNEINQRTAAGDMAGVLTYLTGTPVNATTQDIARLFKDSIQRQGEVAQQNREGEMAYLRGLAPTDLEEPRRQALEATSLNPLRQSRIIQNPQTGAHALQVSVDGGKTWQSGSKGAPAPTPARPAAGPGPGPDWTTVNGVLYYKGKPY